MENIAKNLDKNNREFSFDLKGSVINRKDNIISRQKVMKC